QSPGTAAFIDLAEEISGHDLTAFFQDWIYDPDKPAWPGKFNLSLTSDPAGAPVEPETTVNYTIGAANTGKVALNGAVVEVDVSDLLDDADINPGTLPSGVTLDGTTLTWNVPSTALAATSSVVVPAVLKTGVTTGTLAATASAVTLGGTCAGCATSQAIGYSPIDPAPLPTISGTAQVGQTLTAQTTGWAAGTAFTYQWFRNGEAIAGADSATHEVAAEDLGAPLSVSVTGTKAGFEDTTRTSVETADVVAGDLVLTPTPTITGTPQVGETLTAVPGTWDDGVTLQYQWIADGDAIEGANTGTYQPGPDDVDAAIAVGVTGTKPGYHSETRYSAATDPVAADDLTATPTPTISGKAKVGRTLVATPGTWDDGVTLSYQWTADGAAIAGATARTYRAEARTLGKRIRVEVTGTKPNYAPVTMTSAPTATVIKGKLPKGPVPIIKGKVKVGKKLRVKPGSWGQGITLRYQWYVGVKPISGAVRKKFKVKRAYRGNRIHVVVIGSKVGYKDRSAKSIRTIRVP
ncbi:hypothetical protein, partial [Nocardioides sp.]|uniref:hypothetical protein n=1 Tax=Nocardioides sp. TaxID=35761 RepID=UPI0035624AE7